MKPFNLKEALAGKPVVKGKQKRPITYLAHLPGAPKTRRVYVQYEDGSYDWHCEDGQSSIYPMDKDCRIFMASTKREYWLNVYSGIVCHRYASKEEANMRAFETRIACVRVELEE